MSLTLTSEDPRPPLRPHDAAEMLSVSRKTVYRLIERGELRAVHVGRAIRIDPSDLAQFLSQGCRR
jgi:putative molybdopterin biosynthesis protein